jgi:hypothetical protein
MTKIGSWDVAFAKATGVRARGSDLEHVRAEAQLSERARLTSIMALPHASRFQQSAATMAAAGATVQEAAGVLRAAAGDGAFAHLKSSGGMRGMRRSPDGLFAHLAG